MRTEISCRTKTKKSNNSKHRRRPRRQWRTGIKMLRLRVKCESKRSLVPPPQLLWENLRNKKNHSVTSVVALWLVKRELLGQGGTERSLQQLQTCLACVRVIGSPMTRTLFRLNPLLKFCIDLTSGMF